MAANAAPAVEPPRSFICPITGEIMTDPVIANSGYTYERAAITHYIESGHATDPLTREPLRVADLRPNRALKDEIDAWIAAHRGPEGPPDAAPTPRPAVVGPRPKAITVEAAAGKAPTPGSPFYLSISMAPAPSESGAQPDRRVLGIVIDTSGSMGDAAKPAAPGSEEDGLSRLDLAKHSALTLIEAMGDDDRLVLVSFSTRAHVHLAMEPMTEAGKARARGLLRDLDADGSTNVWDGMQKALEAVRGSPHTEGANAAVVLLTDGEPTTHKPEEVVLLFRADIARNGGALPCTLHTVGYGYSLDSHMLAQLATLGQGTFSFVPDGTMVATVFVNLMAYFCTSYVHASSVIVQLPVRVGVVRLLGAPPLLPAAQHSAAPVVSAPSGGATPRLELPLLTGSVQFPGGRLCAGHSRTHILELAPAAGGAPLDAEALSQISVVVQPRGGTPVTAAVRAAGELPDTFRLACLFTADALAKATDAGVDYRRAREAVLSCGDVVQRLAGPLPSPLLSDLLCDLLARESPNEGQIEKAVQSEAWYSKWGAHYLRSAAGAHAAEFCLNFKDRAMQAHAGGPAKALQDSLRIIFCSLPAPEPTRAPMLAAIAAAGTVRGGRGSGRAGGGGGGMLSARAAAAVPQPPAMAEYYNERGGCFDGDGLVELADGRVVPVRRLCRGDQLKAGGSVRCIVEAPVPGGSTRMVRLGGRGPSGLPTTGVLITPWHPVRCPADDGGAAAWRFPAELCATIAKEEEVRIDTFFNAVLEGGASALVVGGVPCAALGHGLLGPVIGHAYYGTDAVLRDLAAVDPEGWEAGHVRVPASLTLRRNAATRRVEGWGVPADGGGKLFTCAAVVCAEPGL